MCSDLFFSAALLYSGVQLFHHLLEAAHSREDIKVYLHPREHAHLSVTRPFVQVWKTFYSLESEGKAEKKNVACTKTLFIITTI